VIPEPARHKREDLALVPEAAQVVLRNRQERRRTSTTFPIQ
jgi:hypothetical protein